MNTDITTTIIALEKAALEEWNKGNPDIYLSLYASDMTYFDPFFEKRLDSYEQVKTYYEEIRGTVHVDRYEMINPIVNATSEMAVLTFNLISYEGENVYRWNCTEVYKLNENKVWKIIQTHWSFIKPLG